ncbi:Protein of unknown function DUF2015 [Ceraceosorus bombacis]|uniref:Uncharacterized protein n=1 Tax=Ceraceosorus bombacis TaxID=401625 RepID=A0A0P1B907_9BASI|nr:Protein of unknown function DUF2015 [Ceraceosorus bombacis]
MLYTFIYSLVLVTLIVVAYIKRASLLIHLPEDWVDRLPSLLQAPRPSPISGGYSRLSDWSAQVRSGLSSNRFDLEQNIRDQDSRSGLDEVDAAEVRAVMATRGLTFDRARLYLHEERMRANGIDPKTGLSLDAKSVTFSNLR